MGNVVHSAKKVVLIAVELICRGLQLEKGGFLEFEENNGVLLFEDA